MKGLTLRQTVESMFDVIKDRSTGEELVFLCPQPGCGDETGNRSVNLKNGKTSCWRCNKGGDFVAWARFLGYEITDAGSFQSEPLEDLDLTAKRDEETPLPIIRDVKLPTGFTYCRERPGDIYTTLIAEMAERKRLAIEDFLEADVGFTKVDPKWEPYAIFPCFEYGRVVYWQGRTYCDVPGESTKRFPDRQEVPNSAKFWIYGIDELRKSRAQIALVMESILNVLSMRRFLRDNQVTNVAPVCIFKHYLSKPQAKKLIGLPTLKEICLLYDHDATRSSWEKSPMIAARVNVTIAEMPPGPGGEKNDPNDDPVAAWKAFETRQVSDAVSAVKQGLTGTIASQRLVLERPRRPLLPLPGNPLDSLGL
jgi:hypothetical protein